MSQDNFSQGKAMRFTLLRFVIPVATMAAALVIALTTRRLAVTPYLGWAADYVGFVCGALVAVSILSTAYSLARLHRSGNAKESDEPCPACGMPAGSRTGPQGSSINCPRCMGRGAKH